MRLWVKEEAKQLCNEWKMNRFFQILEYDVKDTLKVFINFKLPKLTADLSDILMLVCVALRTKLICEINANIDKLKVRFRPFYNTSFYILFSPSHTIYRKPPMNVFKFYRMFAVS